MSKQNNFNPLDWANNSVNNGVPTEKQGFSHGESESPERLMSAAQSVRKGAARDFNPLDWANNSVNNGAPDGTCKGSVGWRNALNGRFEETSGGTSRINDCGTVGQRDRWHTQNHTDTIRVTRRDSIPYLIEVPKYIRQRNWYDRATSWGFWMFLMIFIICLLVRLRM